jgi:iron complex transport system substrate-binding protein
MRAEKEKKMPRIVSLIPSATESVCALGYKHQLVGRSHECDYPRAVQRLPVCTAPAFEPAGTSAENRPAREGAFA